MLKEKIQKFKENATKSDNKNNKKKVENLVVGILILIVTVIAINTILSDNSNKQESKNTNATTNTAVTQTEQANSESLEDRLKNILSKIDGVGKVDVLISYSESSQIVPMYNENIKETSTEEQDESGGTRVITENDVQKDVIYQEDNGQKTPITQKTINPKIEGTIITAEGASNINVKENIYRRYLLQQELPHIKYKFLKCLNNKI